MKFRWWPQIIKKSKLVLIVSFFLGIILSCPSAMKAESGSVGISATVDRYLAVYKKLDGTVRVETNLRNKYFTDENICIVSY